MKAKLNENIDAIVIKKYSEATKNESYGTWLQ